jgi:hypothetical protein
METARARGTALRRAAPGGRRASTAESPLSGLASRAANELGRMHTAAERGSRRSRPDSVIERIKHLV